MIWQSSVTLRPVGIRPFPSPRGQELAGSPVSVIEQVMASPVPVSGMMMSSSTPLPAKQPRSSPA